MFLIAHCHVHFEEECVARRGAAATVVPCRATRLSSPRERRGGGQICVELADGSRLGVRFSEVDAGLPGGWKCNEWAVFSKNQLLDGRVFARRGDKGHVLGLSSTHPRKCISVQVNGRAIDAPLKGLFGLDKERN